MVKSGYILFLLLFSVTGLEDQKRILMSDPNYTHELEVKVQELTAKVDAMSTNEHYLQSKLLELTANVTKLQSAAAAKEQSLEIKVLELTANLTKLQSEAGQRQVFHSCPDGYTKFHNSCYKLHHNLLSWPEAMTFCKSFGAELAVINNQEEHNYLKQRCTEVMGSYQGSNHWIGASDADVEGEWIWVLSNQPANLIWIPGQPNAAKDANCADLWKGGHYDVADDDCGMRANSICEIVYVVSDYRNYVSYL